MSKFIPSGRGNSEILYEDQSVDDLIIKYMAEHDVPGMVLSIVQAPYTTRVVGYGIADIDNKLLVATNTVFNIGQITNGYTAVAIMQLCEEGLLQLDQSIACYLENISQQWQSITVRNLLSHSSGIVDYSSIENFNYRNDYSQDDIVNLIKDEKLLFSPGTQVNQSATDYYLLGLIIEKASGTSYQNYVGQNQIERIGLKNTFFISDKNKAVNTNSNYKHGEFLHDNRLINPVELAVGNHEVDEQVMVCDAPSWGATFSESGIIASAADISFWDIALAGDILVKDANNRNYLYDVIQLKDGKKIPGNAGWFFPGHKGLMEIKGNLPGYSTFLSRFTDPAELLCVTLLANKSNLSDLDILGRKIAAAFNPKLGVPNGSIITETIQSPYSVPETIERIASIVKKQGGTVFASIDHHAAAEQVDLQLPPTQVLIIGNPAKGTALMQLNPEIAIDLPFKIMATQDQSNQVWLTYTKPSALAKLYNVNPKNFNLLEKLTEAITKLCQKAISSNSL